MLKFVCYHLKLTILMFWLTERAFHIFRASVSASVESNVLHRRVSTVAQDGQSSGSVEGCCVLCMLAATISGE